MGMIPAPPGYKYPALDIWLALIAGDQVWQAGSSKPTVSERTVAGFKLVSLVMVLIVQWVAFAGRVDVFAQDGMTERDLWLVGIGVGSIVAALVLAIRPISLVRGHPGKSANFVISVTWRLGAYLMLIIGTAGLVPRYRLVSTVPLGMVAGSDCLLTLWTLGIAPATRRRVRLFAFSTVHFGVLGALLATAVFNTQNATPKAALGAYCAMWTGVLAAGLTISSLDRSKSFADAQHADERRYIIVAEHTRRAHWLHDDVLSEIRLATLRIDAAGLDSQHIRGELQDLDHRLRLRQLDEIVRGGSPHLYEIIQPQLRRAQSLGIDLYQVPRHDVSQRRVDERTGQLISRAVSVLMSNAINAGAKRIGVAIRQPDDPSLLEITLTDDAGGFELDSISPGRGLATLIRDLAPGTVRRTDAPGGSAMTALIPIPTNAAIHTKERHAQ